MKLLLIKSTLLFAVFASVCTCACAQTFLERTVSTLSKQSATLPIEKTYLQTDKPIYAAGDTIWFKSYVTIGVLHRLSTKSSLLNVQLVNSRNEVKQYLKLELENGMCSGMIALPDSLQAGAYQVRAYTNWMRNFGDDYFFQQNIVIGNAITNSVFSKATYSYNRTNQGQQLNAGITYTDISRSPYSNKEVKYSIIKGAKTIFNGKGVTDDAGNLKINYQSTDTSFFDQGIIRTNIQLDKNSVAKDISIKTGRKAVDVQFLPEGGYIVNGLQSIVAFKSIVADGLGKDIKGVIIDNDDKEVTQIASSHLGMGKFIFTPQQGKTYRAKIGESIINLPQAMEAGYVMTVDNSDTTRLIITIAGTDKANTLNLVARSGGLACYAAAVKMTGNPVTIRISKSKFPSGVAQLTLFSSAGEPMNERMVFINHKEEILNLQLNADKNTYQSREKVNIGLHAQNDNSKPVIGSFSAAVINETGIESSELGETSILSALLLTSGIKGNIEQPNYYFNQTNEQTQADLDLLMLTQGYRGFEWKKILDGQIQDAAYVPEKSLAISGTLKNTNGKPVVKGKVRLFTTTGPAVMVDTLTDEQGRFTFNDMWFRDSTRFVLQATTFRDRSNVIIDIDNEDSRAFKSGANYLTAESDSVPLVYLQNSKKRYLGDVQYGTNPHSTLLKEVVVTDTKPELHSSNLSGPGHNSQVITAAELGNCTNLAVCLIGRLHGVVIDVNGIPHSPRNKLSLLDDDNMQVILDGVFIEVPAPMSAKAGSTPVPTSPFSMINPEDVSSIELLMDPADLAIYGTKGKKGIIIINTKRGDEIGQHASATNVYSFIPKGFYVQRKFYAPQYNTTVGNQKPDLRSTIFWNPDLITDEKGNTTFSYFNADGPGTYRLVIEGIDNDGNIGRQVLRYQVK